MAAGFFRLGRAPRLGARISPFPPGPLRPSGSPVAPLPGAKTAQTTKRLLLRPEKRRSAAINQPKMSQHNGPMHDDPQEESNLHTNPGSNTTHRNQTSPAQSATLILSPDSSPETGPETRIETNDPPASDPDTTERLPGRAAPSHRSCSMSANAPTFDPLETAPPSSSSIAAEAWKARARVAAPWLSLGLGLASAVWMERDPRRAMLFTATAVLAAPALLLFRALARRRGTGRLGSLLDWFGAAAAQSLAQSALFFALPLHVASASWDPGQALYVLLATAAAVVTLWDPLWSAISQRPWAIAAHLGIASTAALHATLPFVGLSTSTAIAVGSGSGAAAVTLALFGSGGWRIPSRYTVLQLLALPLLLLTGPWSAAIPATPFRLGSSATLTAEVERRMPAGPVHARAWPRRVYCYTPVQGPIGARVTIRHIWMVDGHAVRTARLQVRTGRPGGFRTWSRMPTAGLRPGAAVQCRVETEAGQLLGLIAPLP